MICARVILRPRARPAVFGGQLALLADLNRSLDSYEELHRGG